MSEKVLGYNKKITVAIAQVSPVFMNKEKTLEKAVKYINDAGKICADLVVFPESFVPAFPYWQEGPNDLIKDFAEVNLVFRENALSVNTKDTKILSDAAREGKVHVVMGCTELDDRDGSGTLFNSMLFFNKEGELYGRHRKVIPTLSERCFHGMGQGGDNLKVYDTDIGRIGGLVCWENHMITIRALLACQGEEIHIACWPGTFSGMPAGNMTVVDREDRNPQPYNTSDIEPAIRCHAIETQGFVISACNYMPVDAVPKDFPYREATNWDWANGGSSIVDPFGCYIVNPVYEKEQLIVAELDSNLINLAKHQLDVLGHYSRPDLVQLVYKDTADDYLIKMSEIGARIKTIVRK